MADDRNTSPEATETEKKSGWGAGTTAAAVVGGVGAGAAATGYAVKNSIATNIHAPELEHVEEAAKKVNMADVLANHTPETAGAAGDSVNEAIVSAGKDVAMKETATTKAVDDSATTLGKASEENGKTFAKNAEKLTEAETKRAADVATKIEAKAKEVLGATGAARTQGEKDLLKMVVEEGTHGAKQTAKGVAAHVPWTQRLNPFKSELHLSGGQKGIAIAAGTATAVVGGYLIGKAAHAMLGSDKEAQQTR